MDSKPILELKSPERAGKNGVRKTKNVGPNVLLLCSIGDSSLISMGAVVHSPPAHV